MSPPNSRLLKSALFVDFDNIYIGLENVDKAAAQRFAQDPARWLRWIEKGMPTGSRDRKNLARREVLVRRGYLTPDRFGEYRPDFTRAGFLVTDCPPLTSRGKNSADIYMVMDILDVLIQLEHIDEFIIFSSDADFTPVALRLRARDRRTTILPVGLTSAAYRASCDRVITEEDFIEYALGLAEEQPARTQEAKKGRASPSADLLKEMADRVYEAARADVEGEVIAPKLPEIYKGFLEFRASDDWLGYDTLRNLTQAVAQRRSDLDVIEDEAHGFAVTPSSPEIAISPAEAKSLKNKISSFICEFVERADYPVVMAKAAHAIHEEFGQEVQESNWAGEGSFKNFLMNADLSGLEIDTSIPGHIYNPTRHAPPSEDFRLDKFKDYSEDFIALVRRINQVTGAPLLTAQEHRTVFEALVRHLEDYKYHVMLTPKHIRDLCMEQGVYLSRSDITFVTKGVASEAYLKPKTSGQDPVIFGEAFREHVVSLAKDARLELDDEEKALLDDWILGALSQDISF